MSCLIQYQPPSNTERAGGVTCYYSSSNASSSLKSKLVMEEFPSKNQEYTKFEECKEFVKGQQNNDHLNEKIEDPNTKSTDFNSVSEIDEMKLKNEAFYPQRNSPEEYLQFYQHIGSNDQNSGRFPIGNDMKHPFQPIPNTDVFNLNLKLELEQYIQKGDDFLRFRTPPASQTSPTSSLNCSSLSLISICGGVAGSIRTSGYSSPPRRHSFSSSTRSSYSTVNNTCYSLNPVNTNIPLKASIGSSVTSTLSDSGYFRQRSHTYSSTTNKPHPYPISKRLPCWNSNSSRVSQFDLWDKELLNQRGEGFSYKHASNFQDEDNDKNPLLFVEDEPEFRNGEALKSGISNLGSSQFSTRKSSDDDNCLYLGAFGKKLRMVRERLHSAENMDVLPAPQQSLPVDEIQQQEGIILGNESAVNSPIGGMITTVEDIAEEDESQEVNEPLNLCIVDEAETTAERVKHLNIDGSGTSPYSSQTLNQGACGLTRSPSSVPSSSVLRNQLLGLNQNFLGPTPPQYQSRERSASMSMVTLGNRMSVIKETRSVEAQTRKSRSPALSSSSATLASTGAASCSNRSEQSRTSTFEAGPSASSIDMEKGNKKVLRCQDCGKVFSQLRNFRYHRSRHEGTSQFACTCPICNKKFNDKGYLSSHLKIHKNEKEYKCEFCDKRFNQRVAYNMHVRIHTGVKPHECHICDKAFSRKMLLRQHLRTHTGERPYQCEYCPKAFADRSNMLLHQRLHSGVRPFSCEKCGKTFSKNHHLKTHLNHHAGIKPYECPKCKSKFSQSSNMKTHLKKCTTISSPPLKSEQSSAGQKQCTSGIGIPLRNPRLPRTSTCFSITNDYQETASSFNETIPASIDPENQRKTYQFKFDESSHESSHPSSCSTRSCPSYTLLNPSSPTQHPAIYSSSNCSSLDHQYSVYGSHSHMNITHSQDKTFIHSPESASSVNVSALPLHLSIQEISSHDNPIPSPIHSFYDPNSKKFHGGNYLMEELSSSVTAEQSSLESHVQSHQIYPNFMHPSSLSPHEAFVRTRCSTSPQHRESPRKRSNTWTSSRQNKNFRNFNK